MEDYPAYDENLKPLASKLRKSGTLAEVLLWQSLKRGQVEGFRFIRQKPVGNYIVDFLCKELSLAIEVDGSSHDVRGESDRKRQRELEAMGITVLRVTERDVRKDIGSVVEGIRRMVLEISSRE